MSRCCFFCLNTLTMLHLKQIWAHFIQWTCILVNFISPIGLMSAVFANGPGDWGSISGRVIPKTQKMVLDAAFLSPQHYKVRIKGKVAQSWEWSKCPPLHLGVVAIEKGAFGSPSTKVTNFTFYLHWQLICLFCKLWYFIWIFHQISTDNHLPQDKLYVYSYLSYYLSKYLKTRQVFSSCKSV